VSEIGQFDKLLPGVGTGLRCVPERKNHVSVRFGAAWGRDENTFHVSIGEASRPQKKEFVARPRKRKVTANKHDAKAILPYPRSGNKTNSLSVDGWFVASRE
jgi:hypothetical protein